MLLLSKPNHRTILHFLWLAIGGLLIASCSRLETTPAIYQTNETIPATWQLQAKLGVRAQTGNGSLTLNWQQNDDNYRITTRAALGQGAATLQGNSQGIEILRAGKAPLKSHDPQLLMQRTFGWALPIDGLTYWLQGRPQLGPIDKTEYDTQGNLIMLEQAGWSLSFSRYQLINRWVLPGKIRARRGDTALTLIIRDWVF